MISIIVPVYNAANYIAETIHMVQQQTLSDWELILVDDCSSDESASVIAKCIAESEARDTQGAQNIRSAQITQGSQKQIRLISKKTNEGAAAARNTGLDAATGRYIAFLDADDLWQPDKLEKELAFMKEHDAGFAFMSYLFGDEKGIPTGKAVRVPEKLTYQKALSRTIIFTSTVLFDTEKIDRNLLRMPAIESEDTATWWRILQAGHIAYGLDEALVTYRRPGKSLSSNKGRAVRRMWGLYRSIAGMNSLQALLYMPLWAFHATMRRVIPDRNT